MESSRSVAKSRLKGARRESSGRFGSSRIEDQRRHELKLKARLGNIENLLFQVPILLQAGFRYQGKTVRPITYIADFTYWEQGYFIIEDAKGFETDVFKIKWKLLKKLYAFDDKVQLRIFKPDRKPRKRFWHAKAR